MNGRETCKTFWSILPLAPPPFPVNYYHTTAPRRRQNVHDEKWNFLSFSLYRPVTIYQQPFFFFLVLSLACGFPDNIYRGFSPLPQPVTFARPGFGDSVSPNFEKQRGPPPSDYSKYFPVHSNWMSQRKNPRLWNCPRCVPNFDNHLTESSADSYNAILWSSPGPTTNKFVIIVFLI